VQSWLVVAVALAYVGLLFVIAWHGDRLAAGRALAARRAPILYSLSLGIYCSSWTFYGSVGRATSTGFDFLPIYLGPVLMLALGWPLLAKMVRVAKEHNTVSIADFIAARHGKSQGVAALVAIVAVIGITPYIGLQLKAVTSSFDALTGSAPHPASFFNDTALSVTCLMAMFAVLFGMRDITASEHHPGLMRAIAFESIVKLVAFLVVGAAVTFAFSPGLGDMLERARTDPALAHVLDLNIDRPGWWSMTLLAAFATVCLPRQFHVAVVENTSEADLRTAAWMFPLYLVAINIFVVPVALAGLIHFGAHGPDADTFVVSLPIAMGASGLGLLAFIGGLSAATAMVIVSAVALSTMLCNDVVMPLLLRVPTRAGRPPIDQGSLLLGLRRLAVIVILLLANGFNVLVGGAYSLASLGLVSFVAAAQFAPALLGGLYWRGGNRVGALAGISLGFGLWLYTEVVPIFIEAGFFAPNLLEDGPWGLAWLRPRALFGLDGLDPLTHGALWSLGANAICYVLFSLATKASAVERRQATAFVEAQAPASHALGALKGRTTLGDLMALAESYLGADRALDAFRQHLGQPTFAPAGFAAALRGRADAESVRFTERLLAGAIGAASARVVVAGSLEHTMLSRDDVMAVLDEASQAIRFNYELLRATLENVSQGICVCDSAVRVASWNRRFLELNELPAGLVRVGTDLAEIVAFLAARGDYKSDIDNLIERRRQAKGPVVYERTRPDGTVLEIAINDMPDGGFVATYTDVTERHNAAAALERRVAERTTALADAKAEAERANLSKTRFLAAASHDLLQPLHAARLFSTALGEQRQEPLVGKIDASLRSVETLLGALLDVSKLDGGAVTAQMRPFAIDAVMATLAEEFSAIARERGLALAMVRSRAVVHSDPALLRRILQNFLSNALRYTAAGRVLVGCRRVGTDLRIEVWDTGPGIPQADLEDIFLEFRRLAPRAGDTEQGLGLGLAIVDRIARMLGHPVTVRSAVGRGSCFAVTVPRVAARVAVAPAAGVAPPAAARRRGVGFGGALVLCIDNDAAILDGMTALLGGWDCRVLAAPSAEQALARLDGARPALVILDYRLDGGATGDAALAVLRAALGADLPAVFVTADHTEATRERIGGHPVLYKPVNPGALRALLSRLIRPVPRQAQSAD
jgi:Na+/proline symporter/signal transduction histidine kinase/CheY-like chemotaxis protein